jgi:hypothetical protein
MELAERVGHAPPVGRRRRRSALDVGHHHYPVGEQSPIRRRERRGYSETFPVEVLEERGLPGQISIAPGPATSDRNLPVDTHAPHIVGHAASEPFNARHVVTPLRKRLPSHLVTSFPALLP